MSANKNCEQLKSAYDQLLQEKQKFDGLFNEINALRPNIGKNLAIVKDKLVQLKNSREKIEDARVQIEDEYFALFYGLENNSEKIQTTIKKYGEKIFGRIEKKIANQQELNKAEIIILYDIQDKIIPNLKDKQKQKIKEIRDNRDKKVDAPIVFDCQPEEIAWDEKEVNKNTKAYIGPLFPGIFTKIGYLEHIYTTFPEGKIKKKSIELGTMGKEQVMQALSDKKIYWQDIKMINQTKFSPKKQKLNLVVLSVADLGFPKGAKIKEIYDRGNELGLKLCPAEVGPMFRLQFAGTESIRIAMNSIENYIGRPSVYYMSVLSCQDVRQLKLSSEDGDMFIWNYSACKWAFLQS